VWYREEEEASAKKVGAADDASHGLDVDRVRSKPALVRGLYGVNIVQSVRGSCCEA